MNVFFRTVLLVITLFAFFTPLALAQERVLPPQPPEEKYYKAKVIKIVSDETTEVAGYKNYLQTVQLQVLDGDEKGNTVTTEHGGVLERSSSQKLSPGDAVVLIKSVLPEQTTYSIVDNYRLDTVIYFVVGFFFLIILVAGKKGVGSILGMIVSIIIILQYIVPQILRGQDPLFITISGSLAIMLLTIYLAHGISKRTTVALAATSLSLLITGVLAYLFIETSGLTGAGSEDAYMLQLGIASINLKGLLLGGIIIGTLGVLDDITTSQAAAVFELSKANSKLTRIDLIMRGYSVGKEHIASLVNTLVLAYAGASLSLFIIFVLNPANQPYWVILNNQAIVEEVVRTIAGSFGLVLAVPIATVLAAWIATSSKPKSKL